MPAAHDCNVSYAVLSIHEVDELVSRRYGNTVNCDNNVATYVQLGISIGDDPLAFA